MNMAEHYQHYQRQLFNEDDEENINIIQSPIEDSLAQQNSLKKRQRMMPANVPEEKLIEFPDQSSMDRRLNTDAYWKEDSKIRMVQPLGLRKTNQH